MSVLRKNRFLRFLGIATFLISVIIGVNSAFAKMTSAKNIVGLIATGDYLYVDVGEANDCNMPENSPSSDRFFLKIDGKPSSLLQEQLLVMAKSQSKQVRISGGGLGSCDAEHGEKINYVEVH